jgi:menaquinone-9 beta-reductase
MTFDFKVIGSGPTGSYCAAKLAKEGYKVQLVDKAHFPRDKLCGGGLTLKSLSRIRKLHNGFDNAGIVDYITHFYVEHPFNRETIPFDSSSKWLALTKRQEFDNWMRNKAIESGVEYTEERYSAIEGEPLNAHFIIAADGVNSQIGRMIHGQFRNDEVVIATEAYVPNKTQESFAGVILNPTFDPMNAGYSWIFAKHDRIGIGTGVVRNYDKYLNSFRNIISNTAAKSYGLDIKPKDYRNWVIPIYDSNRPATGSSALACIGDALGVADPIYAEGIAAGFISADILVDSFNIFQNFSFYTKMLHNHDYFKQMRWMSFLQKQANSNYELAFKLLQQKNVIDGFIKFINWEQTPQEFVKWVKRHYPSYALKLQYYVWKNKGKEN